MISMACFFWRWKPPIYLLTLQGCCKDYIKGIHVKHFSRLESAIQMMAIIFCIMYCVSYHGKRGSAFCAPNRDFYNISLQALRGGCRPPRSSQRPAWTPRGVRDPGVCAVPQHCGAVRHPFLGHSPKGGMAQECFPMLGRDPKGGKHSII